MKRHTPFIPVLALLLMLWGVPAAARMYQWDDPDTGTPQLSGKPPYWYRGDEPGPRVFVIDNGKVVDDTAVAVPDAQRQQLRQDAFLRAEADEARFRAKLEEAQRLKSGSAELDLAEAAGAAPPAEEAAPAETEAAAPVDESAAEADSMRALVEEWERIREETAKKVIHE